MDDVQRGGLYNSRPCIISLYIKKCVLHTNFYETWHNFQNILEPTEVLYTG